MKKRPWHWLDVVLWPLRPLLIIFWERWCQKKSYAWQWRNFDKDLVNKLSVNRQQVVMADKDPQAKSRQGFWPNFYQTNFGWQKVVVIEPAKEQDADADYQVGFYDAEDDVCQLCTLIRQGRTALLVGPNDAKFFAVYSDTGEVMPIRLQRLTTKSDLKNILI